MPLTILHKLAPARAGERSSKTLGKTSQGAGVHNTPWLEIACVYTHAAGQQRVAAGRGAPLRPPGQAPSLAGPVGHATVPIVRCLGGRDSGTSGGEVR